MRLKYLVSAFKTFMFSKQDTKKERNIDINQYLKAQVRITLLLLYNF